MIKFSEKIKYTLYIDPAVLKRVDDLFKQDGCKISMAKFILKWRYYKPGAKSKSHRENDLKYIATMHTATANGLRAWGCFGSSITSQESSKTESRMDEKARWEQSTESSADRSTRRSKHKDSN